MQALAVSETTIVSLTKDLVTEAHRLSQQEAWPHRMEDWAFVLGFSQGIGALCDGKLVGTAILTPYGDDAATCNMIIVDPSMRGRGVGRQLVDTLLSMAGSRECRLVATASGLPLYEKLGFSSTGEIRQYQGIVQNASNLDDASATVAEASAADLPAILGLDREAIGMDRSVLLSRLMTAEPFLVLKDEVGLRGYLSCRPFGRGHIMGPGAARDDAAFEILTRAAMARHDGKFLRVDLTEAGALFAALAEAAGLAHVGGGVAMVRPAEGSSVSHVAGQAQVYALASQALC